MATSPEQLLLAPPRARRIDSDVEPRSPTAALFTPQDVGPPCAPDAIVEPAEAAASYEPTLQPKPRRVRSVRNLPGLQDTELPLNEIDDLATDLAHIDDDEDGELDLVAHALDQANEAAIQEAPPMTPPPPGDDEEHIAFAVPALLTPPRATLPAIASPPAVLVHSRASTFGARPPRSRTATLQQAARWKPVLERAIASIVSIRYSVPVAFDTFHAGVYTATGFIVDAGLGLVLTNKHVVTDAPTISSISFRNSEEVPARVVYADPIHDFGVLQFDPSQLVMMRDALAAIPLAPEEAMIGLDVKVPGADAGEKLSILSGTIARIDRPCANYGKASYVDWNTFYVQASSNTSGGSSGSPVLNERGNAVALNAGGSTVSASSFFLPLERVVVALDHLRSNLHGDHPDPCPRGTLLVELVQKTYDQCRRAGLPLQLETEFRAMHPELHGCLAIQTVIPGGPADDLLLPGDVLLSIDGQVTNHFVTLEHVLDNAIGRCIDVRVLRQGRVTNVRVGPVLDMHALQPSAMLAWHSDVFHDVSIHLARAYNHPMQGVMLAKAGNVFGVCGIPSHAVMVAVNHKRVKTLQDLVGVLEQLPHAARVPIRYYVMSKKNVELVKVVEVDRMYDVPRLWTRTGFEWSWAPLPYLPEPVAAPMMLPAMHHVARSALHPVVASVQPSLVIVEYRAGGLGIDGLAVPYACGVGIVVDHELGLVVADRMTVPTPLGRVSLCIGNTAIVPCTIVAMDPLHTAVWLMYDVGDPAVQGLRAAPMCSLRSPQDPCGKQPILDDENAYGARPTAAAAAASVEGAPMGLHPGDTAYYVTLSTITSIACVAAVAPVKTVGYLFFGEKYPPQHRTINNDTAVVLAAVPDQGTLNNAGVLCDAQGNVHALWLGFRPNASYVGVPCSTLLVAGMLEEIRAAARSVPPTGQGVQDSALGPMINTNIQSANVSEQVPTSKQTYLNPSVDTSTGDWLDAVEQAFGSGLDLEGHKPAATPTPTAKPAQVLTLMPTPVDVSGAALSRRVKSIALPYLRTLDLEINEVHFWKALDCGVPASWIDQVFAKSPHKYSLLSVRRVVSGSRTADLVHEQDIVLAVDGRAVSEMEDLMTLVPAAACGGGGDQKECTLTLFRDGQVLDVRVPWVFLGTKPAVSAVVWSGALLQVPHRALHMHMRHVPRGLYVSLLYTGSPAHRDGLTSCVFVTHVDGWPTGTVAEFLAAVRQPDALEVDFGSAGTGWLAHPPIEPRPHADNATFQLTTVDLELGTRVIHVETQYRYFPTFTITG